MTENIGANSNSDNNNEKIERSPLHKKLTNKVTAYFTLNVKGV